MADFIGRFLIGVVAAFLVLTVFGFKFGAVEFILFALLFTAFLYSGGNKKSSK